MPLTVGDRLAHYAVTAKIGEGGMGASVIKCWRSDLKLQLSRYLQPILTLTVKGGAKLDHDGGGKLDHLAAGRSV